MGEGGGIGEMEEGVWDEEKRRRDKNVVSDGNETKQTSQDKDF